ncbi:hypothetical protein BJ875DRAFT_213298 [Amylocarpus encephaloides]|uniref:Uncharacterized protein n=1 Tax=Amylocarpus encephaloides TaxID=45428 RepID=A0A9P7Y930_9HELO|nr:hypothetical protein BJ875DRAFT_213298 [Amylocarpus encephaloides]
MGPSLYHNHSVIAHPLVYFTFIFRSAILKRTHRPKVHGRWILANPNQTAVQTDVRLGGLGNTPYYYSSTESDPVEIRDTEFCGILVSMKMLLIPLMVVFLLVAYPSEEKLEPPQRFGSDS